MHTRSLWRASDGHYVEVQVRSQTAIEAELFLAEEVAFGERRGIEKAHIDGFFDLVRVRPSQHDPRDVRLEDGDRGSRMRVHRGVGESLDQSVVGRVCQSCGKSGLPPNAV